MNRRFVNLVTASYNSGMYSLRRLDVAKHLFYPSTAEAQAAANENQSNNGGAKGKPPRIEKLRRLPPASLRLESYLNDDLRLRSTPGNDDTFSLLTSPDGGDGRILHTNEKGHAILCDVMESCSTVLHTLPSLAEPEGRHPISFAGAGEETLYVMRSVPRAGSLNLEALHLHQPFVGHGGGPLGLKWQPLPPPPFAHGAHPTLRSTTMLDGGRVFCVSATTYPKQHDASRPGTYCFDTESQEWWQAGDWLLPFVGRAVHVPELDTWVGFARKHPHHLCAGDLSAVAAAMAAPTTTTTSQLLEAPTLAHVWEDFNLPPERQKSKLVNKPTWSSPAGTVRHSTRKWLLMENLHLMSLGSGRFCVAKTVQVEEETISSCSCTDEDDPWTDTVCEFTVLTGVEVIRGGEGGGGLRMVKHKSKRYMFTDDCVIKWVL